MGVSLNCQDNKSVQYVEAIKSLSKTVTNKVIKFWLRKDWLFYILGYATQYNNALALLHGFTGKIIKERKYSYLNEKALSKKNEEENDPFLPKKRQAFLDNLIELDYKHPNLFTELDIREEVDTFMFEGHDTTSAALEYGIFLLGLHPEIQERAYEEQFNIFGDSDRAANNQDLHEMHYLEMVIKETLRLFPSVPFMSRKAEQDISLPENLVIPEGVNIIFLPYLIHRNPNIFPDPEKFDPDRFLTENCKNRHPYAYIPFSAGPRNCIGQKFAMMELKVVLSTVIRNVKLESITRREELSIYPFVIIRSEPPIQMIARSRIN